MSDIVAGDPTTYFIDPRRGDDAEAGTQSNAAWRTFAPLNKVMLDPGDRVEIIASGSFEQSLLLTGSGTAEAPISVNFAPGRYDFFPTNARRERFNISNCNDDAEHAKAIAIYLRYARHVCITGPDATIVLRGKMIELCIDHSEAISVQGLTFDYHRPTVSEFAVTSVTANHADLVVHPDSVYSITGGKIRWEGEGWSYDTGLAQELIPETDEVWRRKDPLKGLRLEEVAPFSLRAYGKHDMVAGRVFQLRDTFRDCAGVLMQNSKNVILRQVDFYFLHGMGILCQFTENIALESVRIAPEPKRGRTTAAWADCTHFSGCRGKIVMRDCLFCGAHDDATNVHGTHLRIIEQIGEKQIRVRFMHRQTYGFMAFHPGDEIDFVRWDTLAAFAANRVIKAERMDPRELVLTLEKPVSTDWHTGDVIENVTWTPEVEIRGCTAKRIPSRGFLLTTRRRTLVEGNTFVRLRIGVHIESDAEGWFESGCVRDMSIRGNRFVECTRAAVCVTPHCSKPNNAVHRNISITKNRIAVPEGGCAIEAAGTTGLTIAGNQIQVMGPDSPDLFRITSCSQVNIQDKIGNER